MMKIERKSMNSQRKKTPKKVVKKATGKVKKKESTSNNTKVVKQISSKKIAKASSLKEKTLTLRERKELKELEKLEQSLKVKELEAPVDKIAVEATDLEILELEKKKKTYWSDDTERAVVDFLKNDCNYYHLQLERYFEECKKKKSVPDMDFVDELQEKYDWANTPTIIAKKDKIYKDHIHKPLNRLVENIIFNFKLFRSGIDIKSLQTDCLSFVYGKFSNFNPDKNTKSFSFFGTIAKHYLMGEKKDTDKGHQVNLDYDDHKEEADGKETTEIGKKSDLDTSFSLFSHVVQSIEGEIQKKLNNPEEKKTLSENDLKVADAIVNIFKNHELLGAYNKNHVYHLIKEYTGLQTKDITYSLARFRVFYRLLKQDFIKQNVNKD